MSNEMKAISFPKPTFQQWQDEAVKTLKGKAFESLHTKTIENIKLQPFYTQLQLVAQYGATLDQQITVIRSNTSTERFATAQQIFGNTGEAFITNLEESIARGNEVITIGTDVSFSWTDELLEKLADYMTEYPFKISIESDMDPLWKIFERIDAQKRSSVEGFIVSSNGVSLKNYPNVRTNCANTVSYHLDGANAVQELGITLAMASEQATTFDSFEEFENKFFVQFAVDTQFFMEIAKIRAFKVLWKAFAKAYGSQEGSTLVPIIAETSLRSFSKLDPYVNLLRAGNEAFSAAISGVDVFTVHPFNSLTEVTAQSIRIARNTSLVIKEESHVMNVVDTAGGSYYIETLTSELVKAAWAYFLQIEDAGGFNAYKDQLTHDIQAIYDERIDNFATRKASLVGTNVYANPLTENFALNAQLNIDTKRIAKPFEDVYQKFVQRKMEVLLLTFGDVKKYKARADFVTGVLAIAGVVPDIAENIANINDAKQILRQTTANYVIVTANDEDTEALVPALLAIKPERVVLEVAGSFDTNIQAWQQAGLHGRFYTGQNVIQKLQEIAAVVGGV